MYPSEHVMLHDPTVLCVYTMVRAANTLNSNYLIFLQISQLKEKTGPQLLSDVQLLNTQDHLLNPSSVHTHPQHINQRKQTESCPTRPLPLQTNLLIPGGKIS